MAKQSLDLLAVARNLIEHGGDTLRELLALMVQQLMGAEADEICGAGFQERSEDRVNSRNGYRLRRWDTRLGTIDLPIPKLRQGTYFPGWLLEPRRRSEQALLNAITESYVLGVSTRKVERLVETMGVEGISKSQVSALAASLDEGLAAFRNRPLDQDYPFLWLDAMVVKAREAGRSVHVHVVVATGVSAGGQREILACDVLPAEDGAGWLSLLRSLKSRGLRGVKLVVSDAHGGLRDAIASVFDGAAWQRCRTHFMANLLLCVPKAVAPAVATVVRSIFAQPDGPSTWAQLRRVIDQLDTSQPKAAKLLAEAADDLLAFTAFPKAVWRQIWSNNPQERLNKELRRRTDVVGIFPSRQSVLRLVSALLAEQHDEWATSRRYMSLEVLALVVVPPGSLSAAAPDQQLLNAA
jgi:transposase-like protein